MFTPARPRASRRTAEPLAGTGDLLHTRTMERVRGLHHITAIAGPAQENLDFYAGVLGMRLVKKSVNQDDPATYHLFYADADGRPGTDLTFFPWEQIGARRVSVTVSRSKSASKCRKAASSTGRARLEQHGVAVKDVETRFGDRACCRSSIRTVLSVALVEPRSSRRPDVHAWEDSPVPADRQVRGLYGARLWERSGA